MIKRPVACAVLALTFATACAQQDQQGSEGANADSIATVPAASQPMEGMDHGPAKDADHEFLRSMSNHHEGLVRIATQAMEKGASETTKTDAHKLHEKQASERDQMVNMIQTSYAESYMVMPMAKNLAQADSLSQMAGAEHDKTFYRMVVAHHREGIQMVDQFLSRLTKADVRQMAEKMKSDQQREIQELEPKAR